MFKIKTLTVKNFMSVGNSTQAVNFDRKDLTLVLGENVDLGGDDTGARNGTGKTTIINALSYALYGQALTNIRKDNLVNKTNQKAMLVTIDFEVQGVDYRIERGRKTNVLKFYIGDQEQESKDDNSQGDSRETQAEIERLLGMTHDMFKHVVALNTYTEPFLALKPNDQRAIIEQLLGITLLSEKAESLKEQSKATRDAIQQEEANIRAVSDANKRIEEQIEALQRRQMLWLTKHKDDVRKLQEALDDLLKLDIDAELSAHSDLETYTQKSKDIADLNKAIARAEQDQTREEKTIEKLKKEIDDLKSHKCYACGQDLHDTKHEEVLAGKETALKEAALQYLTTNGQWIELTGTLKDLGELGTKPTTFYDDKSLAVQHQGSIANLQQQLINKQAEQDPYSEQIEEMKTTALAEIDYTAVSYTHLTLPTKRIV